MPASSALFSMSSRSNISVFPASIDSADAPAFRIACIVARPTTGTSNRMSCFGLATFTMHDARAGQLSGARNHFVGAFHRLDGHDGAVLHGNRLADIETGNRVGHLVAELEILLLFLGRRRVGS